MRDAMKKYKRNVTIPAKASPQPSLFAPKVKLSSTSTSESKTRSFPKKQTHRKKSKILTDITDMYAVGLSLTK